MAKARTQKPRSKSKTGAANSPKRGRGKSSRLDAERRICELLAEGWTLRQVCSEPDMPSKSTVLRWAHEEGPFADQYARAREVGYHSMADELIDIADDSRNDWIERETKGGGTYVALNDEAVARSKMRIDTRKWLLSKALPKVYGDKIQHTGDGGGPVDVNLTEVRGGIASKLDRIAAALEKASVPRQPHR